MANLSNIVVVLRHWIHESTNRHTSAMAEKVNYNKNKPRICIFNDCDNIGGESYTNKEQVSFPNRLESTLHCKFAQRTSMHECLDGFRAGSIECQHRQLGNRGY